MTSSRTYQYLFLTLIFLSPTISGSEWNIKCRFPDQNQAVFWTGDFVSGFVDFVNTDHPDLTLERITINFVGELVYKVEKKKGKSQVQETIKVKFLNEQFVVHPVGGKGKFAAPYGSHSWPFRLRLDKSLPPSFKTNNSKIPFIHYFLHIKFVRPEWYKFNIEKQFPIIVKHPSMQANATKVELQNENRKHVHLRVVVQKNVIAVGNNVSFDVEIRNAKKMYMRRMSVRLVQILEFGTLGKKQFILINQDLKQLRKFEWIDFKESFQLHVPHTIPATFSSNVPSNSTIKSFTAHYSLEFEAHFPGISTNIRLQSPVIITDPMEETNDEV